MIKKILGGFLLSVPFILIFGFMGMAIGWLPMLIGMMGIALLCGCVWLGINLLMGEI